MLNYKKKIVQTWINFWNFFFWTLLICFLLNSTNFLNLLFYSELVWATLYCLAILCGTINDDLNLFSTSFFLLGLAGLELSIGFLIIINFKNFNFSLSFIDEIKQLNQFLYFNNNKLILNKFLWNKN